MDSGESKQDARDGLFRLETLLAKDPDNPSLKTAVYEAALRCGDWGKAKSLIDQNLQKSVDTVLWKVREGDYFLARREFSQARAVLQAINADALDANVRDVILHNIAYAHFADQNIEACIDALAPQLVQAPEHECSAAQLRETQIGLHKLWLRALHHKPDIKRAWEWAKAMDGRGSLSPRVAGIASLVALDSSDTTLAQKWALAALEHDIRESERSEALVTWASLCLANREIIRTHEIADRVLALNPNEGRAWSIKGFAQLLAGAVSESQALFAKSLESIPRHVGTWHGLGWAQLIAGSHAQALTTFQQALALDRNFAESHGALAVAMFFGGDRAGAARHADYAHGLDKTSLAGQYARALMSGEVQSTQALERLAKRVLGAQHGPLGGSMADWLRKN